MATMPDMPNSALPGADGPPSEASKMIVFGVSFTTTKEGFREYWAQYGELAECELMFGRDGRSRGFGFVLYRDDALNKRIMTMQHSLDGRSLDIKPKDEQIAAQKGGGGGGMSGGPGGGLPPLSKTKIFVGRLLDDVEPDDLKKYFEQYGAVIDVFMPTVHATGKRKNVGFVEFSSAESCSQVLNEPKHIVKGGEITVQAAAPKADRGDRFGGGGGYGYGSLDRGRGSYGRDDFGRGGAYGRERSPGRGYDRGGMDPMGMGIGMEAMWQTMFEGMRAMYERGAGDAWSQQQMGGMGGMGAAYGAAAGGGQAWGMAGQMPGAQMPGGMAGGMQAAGRDMFGGAYGAKPQAYGGYGAAGQGSRIVVENLPRSMMWQGLKDLFKNFGQVSRADVFADGVGSVTFDSPNDASTAVTRMNGFVLEGLQLRVRQE